MVLLARGALRDGEAFVRAAALECLAAAILPVNGDKAPGVVGAIHPDGAVDSRSSPPSAALLTPSGCCSGEEEEGHGGLTARGLGDARSSPPRVGVPPLLTPSGSGDAGEEEGGLTARGLGDAVGAALADSEAMVRRAAADVPHPTPEGERERERERERDSEREIERER